MFTCMSIAGSKCVSILFISSLLVVCFISAPLTDARIETNYAILLSVPTLLT